MERDYLNIDIEKSISTKRLNFKDSFFNIADSLMIILFFAGIAGIFTKSIFKVFQDKSISIDYTYLILKIIAILICSYIVFRKITEKKLFKIKTNLPKVKSEQIITAYFTRLKYKQLDNSDDLISYIDNSPIIDPYNYFIIALDNEILFTVIKDQHRLRLPTIITLWTTYSDLKKCFAKT